MTMAVTAKAKATLAQRAPAIGLMIAFAVGVLVKHVADYVLPKRAVDLGKFALAGFLRGWNSSASTASDCCMDANMWAISPLGKLPPELWNKILKHALTACDGTFRMPCLTDRPFKPDVAVALLRVSRATYHQARPFLYTENLFYFDTFASELPMINKPLGLAKCRLNGCDSAMSGPYINEMHLDVGHVLGEHQGAFMVEAMTYSLNAMKFSLRVENLSVQLHRHSLDTVTVSSFLRVLQKVQVIHSLTIYGDADKYNTLNVFEIAIQMGMKAQSYVMIPEPKKDGYIDGTAFCIKFLALNDGRDAQ